MKILKKALALLLAAALAVGGNTAVFAALPEDCIPFESFEITAAGKEKLKDINFEKVELVNYTELQDEGNSSGMGGGYCGELRFYISLDSTKLPASATEYLEAGTDVIAPYTDGESLADTISGLMLPSQPGDAFDMCDASWTYDYRCVYINDYFLVPQDGSPINTANLTAQVNYDSETKTIRIIGNPIYQENSEKKKIKPYYALGAFCSNQPTDANGWFDLDLHKDQTVTINNGKKTLDYTVTLDSPWKLKWDDKTYTVASVSDGGAMQEIVFANNVPTLKKGGKIEVVVTPPAGQMVDTATLTTKHADTPAITPAITGNTISFTMPSDVVTLSSVTFKTAVEKTYPLTSTGTDAATGSVAFKMGGSAVAEAAEGALVTAEAQPMSNWDDAYEFVSWDAAGLTLTEEQKTTNPLPFTMPANTVNLKAVFRQIGTEVVAKVSPETASEIFISNYGPASTRARVELAALVPKEQPFPASTRARVEPRAEISKLIKAGNQVVLELRNSKPAYVLEGWEVKDEKGKEPAGMITGATYVQWVSTGTGKVTATANFRALAFANIDTVVNDAAMGTAAATVDGKPASVAVLEGSTVTLTATPKPRYKLQGWEVKDSTGVVITTTPVSGNDNAATFTMPDTGKDITAKAIFVLDTAQASDKKEITLVQLLGADQSVIKSASKAGTAFTIDLIGQPQELVDKVESGGGLKLKIVASEFAHVAQEGGYNDATGSEGLWGSGNILCYMSLNTPVKFTVTAENGTTQDYTIEIKYTPPTIDEIVSGLDGVTADNAVANKDKVNAAAAAIQNLPDDDVTANEDVVKQVETLYEAANGITVEVSDTAGLGASQTGAAFSAKNNAGSVKLQVENITATKPIPAAYQGKKLVPLEISLIVNGNSAATAATPVIVTMNVPSELKGASNLKVLHYHGSSTTPTVITPTISGSKLKFSLTKFSHVYLVGDSAAPEVTYDLGISYNKTQGKIELSVDGAKAPSKVAAGKTVTVKVTPEAGYQMTAGSLKYALATAGGASTAINESSKTFVMPAANISVSCTFEESSTPPPEENFTDPRITSFVISGTKGVINQSTGAITMTLPRGTDVTMLVPSIATKNVASLSPDNGVVQNFTSSVVYTVTGTDGSSRQYVVSVYVQKGSAADQMWDDLTDFTDKYPWWEYADDQISEGHYPKYWR